MNPTSALRTLSHLCSAVTLTACGWRPVTPGPPTDQADTDPSGVSDSVAASDTVTASYSDSSLSIDDEVQPFRPWCAWAGPLHVIAEHGQPQALPFRAQSGLGVGDTDEPEGGYQHAWRWSLRPLTTDPVPSPETHPDLWAWVDGPRTSDGEDAQLVDITYPEPGEWLIVVQVSIPDVTEAWGLCETNRATDFPETVPPNPPPGYNLAWMRWVTVN